MNRKEVKGTLREKIETKRIEKKHNFLWNYITVSGKKRQIITYVVLWL
jgi:hypothetical protein